MKLLNCVLSSNLLFDCCLQNTYGAGAKAVALRVSADRVAFFECRILSHQDTLLDDTGRHFYRNCFIQGDTDFICGNAASLFEVIKHPIYLKTLKESCDC